MRSIRILLPAAFAAILLVTTRGSHAAPEPEVKIDVAEGTTLNFVVRRDSDSERGDRSSTQTSTIEYKVTVKGRDDSGGLKLEVAYASVKASSEGGNRSWKFDSSSDADDDVSKYLRRVISKPVKVTVSKGTIQEISGFPEAEGSDDQQARRRRFTIGRVAGRGSLRRDLELILASAVQGKALEKDKKYTAPVPERSGDADQGRRGRRRFGRGATVAMAFQDDERIDGVPAASFALSTVRPPVDAPADQDRPRFDRKETGKGTAKVSFKDGLLLKLEMEVKSDVSGEFNGQSFNFSTKSSVEISRKKAKKAKKSTVL